LRGLKKMASMCSNPDCGNIRRVEGVCPECGSPAEELGFKEGTALIKLKKENMNRKNDEVAAEAQKIIDQEMGDKVGDENKADKVEVEGDFNESEEIDEEIAIIKDEQDKEVISTSKWGNSSLLRILVFIICVVVFYIIFTLLLT
jgi:ribosomal protein L32